MRPFEGFPRTWASQHPNPWAPRAHICAASLHRGLPGQGTRDRDFAHLPRSAGLGLRTMSKEHAGSETMRFPKGGASLKRRKERQSNEIDERQAIKVDIPLPSGEFTYSAVILKEAS